MAIVLYILFFLFSPRCALAWESPHVSIEGTLASTIDYVKVRQIGGDKVLIELNGRGLRRPAAILDTDCAAAFRWENTVMSSAGLNKNGGNAAAWELKYDYPLAQRVNFFVNDNNGIEMKITGERPLRLKRVNGMENSDSLSVLLETIPRTPSERERTAETQENPLPAGEKITLEMREAKPADAFRALASLAGVNLIADKSVSSEKITFSFKNAPFGEIFHYLLGVNDLAYVMKGNTLFVGSFEAIASASGAYETRSYRVAYADIDRAASLVAAVVPRLKTPAVDERTRTLYVTATAGQHEKVAAFLRGVDHPGRQVMLEARLIEISKSAKQEIEAMISSVYNGWVISYGAGGGGIGYSYINKKRESAEKGGLAEAPGLTDPTVKLLDAGLRSMESRRKGKILASPSLVALDGSKAVIKLTRNYLYQSSVDSDGNVRLTEQETGPTLEITPQIGRDGLITMKLRISSGEIIGFHKSGSSETPETSKREVDTCVRVRDGELFVIGGLYADSRSKSVTRVPILGNIPLIGELFTSRSEVRINSELAFIVVPHILEISRESLREEIISRQDLPYLGEL